MNFGEKIKILRKKAGLSQNELESKINVNPSLVSSWERSHYPPLHAIEKICNYFNMPLWKFFIDNETELENFIPDFITSDDIEELKILNTQIRIEDRIAIKQIRNNALKIAMRKSGYNI